MTVTKDVFPIVPDTRPEPIEKTVVPKANPNITERLARIASSDVHVLDPETGILEA